MTIISILISHLGFGQSEILYSVDLRKVKNDSLFVEAMIPSSNSKQEIFLLPSIIPGVYSKANYGRFVSDLKAFDQVGSKLKVKRLDMNSWKIYSKGKLHRIQYKVIDSYDHDGDPVVFQPAGTNFEKDNFVLNAQGYIGYFEGKKKDAIRLRIKSLPGHYGITGMVNISADREWDEYFADDYDYLVDSPIMYCKADTSWLSIKNTDVLVGVYSPFGKINASEIGSAIEDLLLAQANYLGGVLPVDKYAFIFYFNREATQITGALEHSYSSIYFMQDLEMSKLENAITATAAHEFFHILTPLTIHSREIEDFDFNDPKMSKHLWLYESVTEYFACHARLTGGIIDRDYFRRLLHFKFTIADDWPHGLSMTDMSKNVLRGKGSYYLNVYHHGAIICMALDIKIRETSNGEKGLIDLMNDLSKKYGKKRPFEDDELFSDIEKLTNPEIREFIDNYIDGSEPLPAEEIFDLIGLSYKAHFEDEAYSLGLGGIELADYKGTSFIGLKDSTFNEMGRLLGFKQGDIILTINDRPIPEDVHSKRPFITAERDSLKNLDKLKVRVARKTEEGYKERELVSKVKKVKVNYEHYLKWQTEPSPEQQALRDSWLRVNEN